MLNIDLLPEKAKLKLKQEKQTSIVFYIALSIIIIFALSSLYLNHYNKILKLESAQNQIIESDNQKTLETFNPLKTDIGFLNDRFALAQTISNSQTALAPSLIAIKDASSSQIIELKIDLDNDPNFILQMAPTTNQNLVALRQNLEKTAIFKNIEQKNNSFSFNLATSRKVKP